MKTPGDPYDAPLLAHYAEGLRVLPAGSPWFDAHTHIGHADPDGLTATGEEIVAGLDRAGHARALVFTLREPNGYPPANDRVLAEAAASGERLVPLGRVDPRTGPAAVVEARRCLEAGAAGIKLHPRGEGFTLGLPVVADLVALAGAHDAIVMIHAGRGIPSLGADAVALARANPAAAVILAHAGICDLAWLGPEAAVTRNLYFDTAWWNVADLVALFALIPPGQILHATDMPYGSAALGGLLTLRAGQAVGLSGAALASVAGGQLGRLVGHEPALDLGPAPGAPAAAPSVSAQRAAQHLCAAVSVTLRGGDPEEAFALAGMACAVPAEDGEAPLLAAVRALSDTAARAIAADPDAPTGPVYSAIGALALAGTAQVPVGPVPHD